MDRLFDWDLYGRLFALPCVQAVLIAAVVVGLVAGVLGSDASRRVRGMAV
jgi:hypothetical protein